VDNLPRVLDPRIYRAGFLPILFALVLVGFSLREPPRPLKTSLAPDAFDGAAAFRQLDELATAAPLRRPGSAGDRLVARRVEDTLRRSGFRVGVRRFGAETVDGERELETVVGERAGFSNRRVIVLAHRDALGRGARAELSGTAALLELARVLGGRTLNRTLVLASTSGGTAGLAAAERLARGVGGTGSPVDAVLVLGDMAGVRTDSPLVVPWSRSTALAPLELRRTVESALMTEAGLRAGTVRPGVQLARLAFPLTLGEQGPFNAHGFGAVLLSASGERAPAADAPVSELRLTAFGRAALRSIGALDGGGDVPGSEPYMLLEHKVLPAWPVRLLAIALMLPVLLAAVDGFARVRRRRERVGRWLGWVGVGVLPFLLAALLAIGLFHTGLIDAAPEGPVAGLASAPNAAALASVIVLLLLAWFGLRPVLLRLLGLGGANPAAGGAATAIVLVLCATTFVVWIGNPYASLLLIPALHLWLLAMAPETHLRRLTGLALWVLGLLPPLLVAYACARQFGLDPLELAWMGELLVAGGGLSLLAVLLWSVVLGCAAAALVVIVRASGGGPAAAAPITVRGPQSYAGPGSLGGTESALRR
jgi:hypothetical protein